MSLIECLGKDYKNLPDIIAEYEKGLENVKPHLLLENKKLETANVEQPGWQLYYESRRAELHSLVKFFESKTAAVQGELFRKYTEKYTRELSDRQKDKYITNEKKYLNQYEIYLEIKEIYEKYVAVCNAFVSRGYALNNITKIRVASIEDAII